MRVDNIEIGTSDFRLLVDSAEGNGISVEPVPYYFNRLPNRAGWHRVNAAISDYRGTAKMWHVDPRFLGELPRWVRGCNSIHDPHPTVERKCQTSVDVEVITMKDLFDRFSVTSVGFLKLDTEGHDHTILMDYFQSDLPIPDRIEYESNILTSKEKLHELHNLLFPYYNIKKGKNNTICE